MSGITQDSAFRINGVISTDKTVLQNLDTLCSAAGAWLSYDNHEGKWGVVINRAGTSVASFDDSNILTPIKISSTGMTELYNSVRVEFPHIDINDNTDFVEITIPDEDRNTQEPDNQLLLQYDIINNPVQAQYLGMIELKQNRLDQVVQFSTDYSKLQVKAGDIIDITSDIYNWTNKPFRVVVMQENDNDDGSIVCEITAVEYSDSVYDTSDLSRYTVEYSTGIQSIGAIGVPGLPEINKVEFAQLPHITITSTAPTGIVEGMEVWYSLDSDVVYDNNRTYNLLTTVKPTLSNTFIYGDTMSYDYSGTGLNINANVYVKTRGVNSTTVGPFSEVGAFVYDPTHLAGAINPSTTVVDANGNSAITSAPNVTSLISSVDSLHSTDPNVYTGSNSLWPRVVDGFTTYDKDAFGNILNSQYLTPGYGGSIFTTMNVERYTSATITDGNLYTFYPLALPIRFPRDGIMSIMYQIKFAGIWDTTPGNISTTKINIEGSIDDGANWTTISTSGVENDPTYNPREFSWTVITGASNTGDLIRIKAEVQNTGVTSPYYYALGLALYFSFTAT